MGRYKRSFLWAFHQFINRISQDIAYKFNTGNCKPSRIIFCLTLRCNIRCRQCGIWRTPNKKELTTQQWKEVIIRLKDWLGPYRLQIAGGEIFLRDDIVELVKFASSHDVLIGMVSNGTMINEEMAKKLVEASLGYFDISIDGINAKTHDYIRGVNGVYEKAMRTIKYLKHYIQEMNSDLSIIVATVIMGTNMHELVDIVEWAQKEGLAGVIFNPLGPACDSDSEWHKKSELWPREKDLKQLDNILDQLVAMKKKGARILNSEEQFPAMKEYFKDPSVPRGGNCMVGATNFLMSCDGNVHLCFHMPSIGNLKGSFKQTWKSDEAKRARKMIKGCKYECSPGNFIYRGSLIKDIQRYLRYR